MTEYKEFSLLMSIYDKEKPEYLRDCLESILNQTFKPSEIILVFDGYIKEELEDVVGIFIKSLNIDIVRIRENVGLGKALNIGLNHCNFSYVARMDTDDICLKERFQRQIEYLSLHPEVDILGTNIIEFNGEDTRFKDLPLTPKEILSFSLKKNPLNHMSVIFKKEKIQEIGGYKHHLYMEDYNLWIRCLTHGLTIYNIPERLLKVRVNDEMISRRRGMKYIRSELKLIKLKWDSRLYNKNKMLAYSIIRITSRIIPRGFLKKLYNLDRK